MQKKLEVLNVNAYINPRTGKKYVIINTTDESSILVGEGLLEYALAHATVPAKSGYTGKEVK